MSINSVSINSQPVIAFQSAQKTSKTQLQLIVKKQLVEWFYSQSGITPEVNDIQIAKFQVAKSSKMVNELTYEVEFAYNDKTYATRVDENGKIFTKLVDDKDVFQIKEKKLSKRASEAPEPIAQRKWSILKYAAGALVLGGIATAIFAEMLKNKSQVQNKNQTFEEGVPGESSSLSTTSKTTSPLNELQQQLFDDFKQRVYRTYGHLTPERDSDFKIKVEPRETCPGLGLGLNEPLILFQLDYDTTLVRGQHFEIYNKDGKRTSLGASEDIGSRSWKESLSRTLGLNDKPSVCEK